MGKTEPPRRAAVRILRIAGGGDGVARLDDGMTVFVPRSAPGDLVTLRDVRKRRGFARARIADLIEAGPDRTEAPCPHYTTDSCGGCQLQHLTADAQREARRRAVGDALRRIGKFDVEDPPIEPAPDDWAYRTRLSLHAVNGRIGLRPLDRPADAFELDRCLIADVALQDLWSRLRRLRDLLPAGLGRLSLRRSGNGVLHLLAELPAGSGWTAAPALASELERQGLRVILWAGPAGAQPTRVAGDADEYPAASFEQVNPGMGARIRRDAVEALAPQPGEEVWDLYAGIGETTALLVGLGARVSSVESDERAVEWAKRHGPPARRYAASVEQILPALVRPASVITNPPRTGMDERAVGHLLAAGPSRVVYISCDPATLARDLGRLRGYALAGLRAYDLFPQTAHVETVAVMERA